MTPRDALPDHQPVIPLATARHYRLFGLTLHSEFALPALAETAPAQPDLTLAAGGPIAWPDRVFSFGPDRQIMYFPAIGAFTVLGADRILYHPATQADARLLEFPLLGPVMAFVLHLRGLLVLHGSAVGAAGRAAVFLGDKGAGKSTLAAACVAAGQRLVTDDLAALAITAPGMPVLPAFAQIKLSSEAGRQVAPRARQVLDLSALHGDLEKRQHREAGWLAPAPVPAAGLFVLTRGPAAALKRFPRALGLPFVLRYSYLLRYGEETLSQETRAAHFARCGAAAGSVPVLELTVPDRLGEIGAAVALVARYLEDPETAA